MGYNTSSKRLNITPIYVKEYHPILQAYRNSNDEYLP
jgi:hypothetical protein